MIDRVDQSLRAWVESVIPTASVTLDAPGNDRLQVPHIRQILAYRGRGGHDIRFRATCASSASLLHLSSVRNVPPAIFCATCR